jgi:hypothetical protein
VKTMAKEKNKKNNGNTASKNLNNTSRDRRNPGVKQTRLKPDDKKSNNRGKRFGL